MVLVILLRGDGVELTDLREQCSCLLLFRRFMSLAHEQICIRIQLRIKIFLHFIKQEYFYFSFLLLMSYLSFPPPKGTH